mmetsp:Transcript_11815/g.17824  ORF Transcript_11815/g.17824 Transcript_11815/m.17824 type:complete len:93 (-) Transcript_11815:59-337(-)
MAQEEEALQSSSQRPRLGRGDRVKVFDDEPPNSVPIGSHRLGGWQGGCMLYPSFLPAMDIQNREGKKQIKASRTHRRSSHRKACLPVKFMTM